MHREETTHAEGAGRRSRPHALPFALFAMSGASGLMIEVLWRERLGQVFGATAEATSATLAAFFVGLGLGAWFWGARAASMRRPLRAYGWLELGAAATGLLYFAVLPVHGWVYASLRLVAGEDGALLTLARLLLSLLFLGPPAFFLGGTFPVIAQALVRGGRELGRAGPLLYALNTLGATVGVALAAFVLPPRWGFARSYLLALGTAAAVGVVALLYDRRAAWRTPRDASADDGRDAPAIRSTADSARGRLPVGLALGSGFLAIGLEVAWMRMFAQAVPNSVYVFAIVLLVFLAFMVGGGFLARWLAAQPWAQAHVLVGLLGGAVLLVGASVGLFLWATNGLQPPPPGLAWGRYLLRTTGIALLVVGPPTLVLGAVFPYLLKVAERSRAAPGDVVGRLAAWNTLGAVLGPLVVAFVLFPRMGLWRTIGVLAFVYAVLAFSVARRSASRRLQFAAAGVLLLSASGLVPDWLPVVRLRPGERLIQTWESTSGTVAVVDAPKSRKLVYNNVFTLGGTHDVRWEAMQAHIPLLLHPEPRDVFFLGLGTGATAGGAMDHDVETVTVAELVPEVIRAAQAHFGEFTNGLFDDDRARVLAADARHYLRWTDETYDVIVGDLFFPWEPGTANLYTREHFEAVRARLEPGGLFAQWLPCYQLSPEEFAGIARTMVEAFPLVTLWRGDFFSSRPILALVGHESESALDGRATVAHARRLLVGDGADLARDAGSLPFHLYVGNLTQGRALLGEATPVTDDFPWIAYSAPKGERGGPRRFVGERLLAFEAALGAAAPAGADPYLARLEEGQRVAVAGGLLFRRMAVAIASFRQGEYATFRLQYRRLLPEALRSPVDAWVE